MQSRLHDLLVTLRREREADRLAILRLQERVEDLEDAIEGEVALAAAEGEQLIPWEDVKRELGL